MKALSSWIHFNVHYGKNGNMAAVEVVHILGFIDGCSCKIITIRLLISIKETFLTWILQEKLQMMP